MLNFYGSFFTLIKINLAGTEIKRVTSCKYLGVLIDEELKWVDNIDYIYNKVVKYIL